MNLLDVLFAGLAVRERKKWERELATIDDRYNFLMSEKIAGRILLQDVESEFRSLADRRNVANKNINALKRFT